jgi:hypothetical protein
MTLTLMALRSSLSWHLTANPTVPDAGTSPPVTVEGGFLRATIGKVLHGIVWVTIPNTGRAG